MGNYRWLIHRFKYVSQICMVKVLHFSSTILHLPTEDNTTKIQLTLKVFSRGTAKQRLGSIPQRISNMSLRFSIQRKQWTSLWRFHQSNACKIQIKCSSSLLRALSRSLWKSSHCDFEVLQVKFFTVKRKSYLFWVLLCFFLINKLFDQGRVQHSI